MKRKKFLQTSVGAAALIAMGKTSIARASAQKPFKIAAGKGMFNGFFFYLYL